MAPPTLPSPRSSPRTSDAEAQRAKSLAELAILDTAPESSFDGVASLAAHVCGTETALVTLLDRERQWCKAMLSCDLKEIPRQHSFCTHATELPAGELLVVEDATRDPRFAANPLVLGAPGIRFYAGAPVRDASGVVLGAVCVLAPAPRALDAKQRELLGVLGRQVESLFQERLRARAAAAERQLADAVRENLVQANRMATYGGVAVGIGHELRNVGRILQLELEKLARDAEGRRPIGARDVAALELVATRLRRQSSQLLAGGQPAPPSLQAFEPADVVRAALTRLAESGRTKDLVVSTSLPDTRAFVFQDPAAFEQVVTNLVTNAADAIHGIGCRAAGGKIAVRLSVDDAGTLELTVEDDGPGMSEDLKASIFDAYFTTKPASRGSGLGLPVVERIVSRAFGGTLTLTSEVGRGTTVCLTIPARLAATTAA